MGGAFDSRKFEQSGQERDTELTLTPTMVLVLVAALVALCSVCFGLGYASARHSGSGDTQTVGSPSADGSIPAQTYSGQPKPAATPQAATPATSAMATEDADSNTSTKDEQSGATTSASNAQPQVKPALVATNPAQVGQVAAASVSPALTQSPQVMVQIAAVGQQQDADVLVGALRRRGYAVGARREPLDGLIHVKIGPFKTAAEAESWQQKLLNDGYNAEIQQ